MLKYFIIFHRNPCGFPFYLVMFYNFLITK
nr:MAG TPA: hypothetical protein [Caudoviricetes sp.]